MGRNDTTPTFYTTEISRPDMNKTKRPGYSAISNTLKPLRLIASGQLSVGDKLQPRLLEDLGISRSKSYEVRTTWRHLALVDNQDCITPACEQLAHASGEQYRARLEALLREAYADIFERLDLAHINRQALKDAFQCKNYVPTTILQKMITLFKGLCHEAGLIIDETRAPKAPEEQMIETHHIISQETTILIEGNQLMNELSSISQRNDSAYAERDAQIEEMGTFLVDLLQLPKNPGWREPYRSWWNPAIYSSAQQIVQVMKDQKEKKR